MTGLILFALLFAGNIAFATDHNIKAYLTLVNEAELLICNDKLKEAVQHYDKAFSLKASPVGKDLLNAILCTYQLDDTGRFKSYATTLLKNGAFSSISNFRKYIAKVPVGPDKDKYGKIWDDLSRKIIPGLDTAYRNQLIRLVQADQDVRHFFVGKYYGDYNNGGKDSFNVFDSLNVIKLKKLFDTKGFLRRIKSAMTIIFRATHLYTN
ncbi:hypothetical protein [Taibaiella chishuiensis]|uniref:Tetratricopeptide repeat protein n=1 Tax=Taibaiella chishuiensis TaxID=1434707 RepID=A0A2P8D0C0_9BACT|nr:hypothetical protein [Taibaiella chishuiensis]PSK90665.1 hypothetical protein B0I18_10775 [Taibaiella chishuiensis]